MPTRTLISTPSPREIRTERVFAAPRERVWQALTNPELLAHWWGRGNAITIERLELERGGHWRIVEHGTHGFEGRYREVTAPERLVRTFEWDGMPGYVIVETTTLEDLGKRTRLVTTSLFHTSEERDGFLGSGMEQGLNDAYAALDRLLAAGDAVAAPASEATPGAASVKPGAASVKKVAFTMYPVLDMARARAFYEETLGLQPGMAGSQGNMRWVEYDLPGGGCLALTNAIAAKPSAEAGGTIALEVENLAAFVERLRSRGVTFKAEHIRGPRCTMAACVDSEGNPLVLHELDRG